MARAISRATFGTRPAAVRRLLRLYAASVFRCSCTAAGLRTPHGRNVTATVPAAPSSATRSTSSRTAAPVLRRQLVPRRVERGQRRCDLGPPHRLCPRLGQPLPRQAGPPRRGRRGPQLVQAAGPHLPAGAAAAAPAPPGHVTAAFASASVAAVTSRSPATAGTSGRDSSSSRASRRSPRGADGTRPAPGHGADDPAAAGPPPPHRPRQPAAPAGRLNLPTAPTRGSNRAPIATYELTGGGGTRLRSREVPAETAPGGRKMLSAAPPPRTLAALRPA